MSELCFQSVAELRRLIVQKQLSARELLDACLDRIHRDNPRLNAIVTLDEERARQRALTADERQASGAPLPPLHGIPVAHKDLVETADIRTTFGSPIYRDYIPSQDALIVQRWREAGAITIGKTNTPEFGAGSQTFNEVFGATLNPFDLSKTCGGSSGGAAVGLACGFFPLADGSDTGGSLRNPAAFCNVVGLRPSAGRVPQWPNETPWFTLSVQGAMGRTVGDLAQGLSALAGPDSRIPISLPQLGETFADPAPTRNQLESRLRPILADSRWIRRSPRWFVVRPTLFPIWDSKSKSLVLISATPMRYSNCFALGDSSCSLPT